MKKFIVCIIFFLSLCIGFAFISEHRSSSNMNISTDYVLPINYPEVKQTECTMQISKKYKLKEYEGNLAVFKNDSISPIKITSISIENLPPTDQQMLKDGIEASSEEELNTLLEDYGS